MEHIIKEIESIASDVSVIKRKAEKYEQEGDEFDLEIIQIYLMGVNNRLEDLSDSLEYEELAEKIRSK
jgi:hypothetical protein